MELRREKKKNENEFNYTFQHKWVVMHRVYCAGDDKIKIFPNI